MCMLVQQLHMPIYLDMRDNLFVLGMRFSFLFFLYSVCVLVCLDVAFGKSDVYRKIDIKLIGVFLLLLGERMRALLLFGSQFQLCR